MYAIAAVAGPSAVAEPSALKPVCAQEQGQKRLGSGQWKGVVMQATAIVLSGGFGGKRQQVAQTILYEKNGQQWRFVQVHKRAGWFVNGCSGPKADKTDLPAVHVISLLRERYVGAETAVAEEAPAVADPMHDLDDVLEEKPIQTKKPKNNRNTSLT